MKALKIQTDGQSQELVNSHLETLQEAVDGYIEAIHLQQPAPCVMYVNEDGRAMELLINQRATELYQANHGAHAGSIVGNVVITGPAGTNGEPLDVPEQLEKQLQPKEWVYRVAKAATNRAHLDICQAEAHIKLAMDSAARGAGLIMQLRGREDMRKHLEKLDHLDQQLKAWRRMILTTHQAAGGISHDLFTEILQQLEEGEDHEG